MIRKQLAMIVIAVALNACSDSDNEKEANRDKQKFSQEVSGKDILKIETTRDRKTESSSKSLSGQTQRPLMMSSEPLEEDLNDIEDIEELEQYREDYDKAADMDEKTEAFVALVQADEKNAVALLQEAYDSPEVELRKEAVLQMPDFSDHEEVVDLLLKALDDPEPEVVLEAIEGVSGLESERAMEELKKLAQSHPDKSVREAAQEYVDQEQENGQ